MPSEQGRDQVAEAEDVKGSREDGARDAVEDREVPGYLGLVDGEVRGDGAVEALGFEDFVGFGGFYRLGWWGGGGSCGGSSGWRC